MNIDEAKRRVIQGPCFLEAVYVCHFLLLMEVVPNIAIYCRAHKEAPASDGTMTSLDASPEGTEPEIDHSSDQTNVRIKIRVHITGVTSY